MTNIFLNIGQTEKQVSYSLFLRMAHFRSRVATCRDLRIAGDQSRKGESLWARISWAPRPSALYSHLKKKSSGGHTPLLVKAFLFPGPTSQALAARKKEVWEERSRPEKLLVLQDSSTKELLLQDPLPPNLPTLAPPPWSHQCQYRFRDPQPIGDRAIVPPPLYWMRNRRRLPTSLLCHEDIKSESNLP